VRISSQTGKIGINLEAGKGKLRREEITWLPQSMFIINYN